MPIKFGVRSDFRKELHKKVYEYLDNCGKPIRAPLAMYRKTAILLAWLALAYTALVFISSSWWQALLSSALMAAAIAGIGFNIPHDAG
ncbi:MAG: acyl-CoA desaturase, partial [Candidatus Sericytochromatia bacterium]|nr:acyl-CoA desaturase [Candidatus Tanganyikabacteria bacterium]